MTDEKNQTYPPTYSQRLFSHIEAAKQETYTLSDIQALIKEFGMAEYEKRKATADIISFGKYKDRKVSDVASFDLQYLAWMAKQPFMDNKKMLMEHIQKALA